MKSYKEYITERNPYHPGKMTIEKFAPFVADGYYMTFTEFQKVGINPKSKYSTPLGLYTYPLYADDFKKKFSENAERYTKKSDVPPVDRFFYAITNSVPFMGDNPNYLYVIKENPHAKIYHTSKGDYTWDDIKAPRSLSVLKKYISKSVMIDENDFENILNGKESITVSLKGHEEIALSFGKTSENRNVNGSESLCFIWGLTRLITLGQDTRSMKLWGQCLQELGFDGISDDAALGLIHPNEPFQCVFFSMGAIKAVEKIDLERSDNRRARVDARRDLIVALKLTKNGRIPKKAIDLLARTLDVSKNPYSFRDTQQLWYSILMMDDSDKVYDIVSKAVTRANQLPGSLPSPIMLIIRRDDVFEKNPDALAAILPGAPIYAIPFARKHICPSVDIPRELIDKFGDGYDNIAPRHLPKIEEYISRKDFNPDEMGWNMLRNAPHVHAMATLFSDKITDEEIMEYVSVKPQRRIRFVPKEKWTDKLIEKFFSRTEVSFYAAEVSPVPFLKKHFLNIPSRDGYRTMTAIIGAFENNRDMTPENKKITKDEIKSFLFDEETAKKVLTDRERTALLHNFGEFLGINS